MKPNMKYFSILAVVVVLLLVALYFFRSGSEGFDGAANHSFTLYYADWCPHCKSVAPVFKDWMKQSPMTVNGKSVTLNMVEASANQDKSVPVKGFPTFLLKTPDGQYKEFQGDRAPAGWESWLKSNL
jgi:hypothetical protein